MDHFGPLFELENGSFLDPIWTQNGAHFGLKMDHILDQIEAHFGTKKTSFWSSKWTHFRLKMELKMEA